MNIIQFQKHFFNQVDEPQGLSHLFDFLPEVYLFVKNTQGQFTKANQAFADLVGASSEQELIGKTDRDFFLQNIADKYIDEDRQVMEQKKSFVNKVWLVPNGNGLLKWYLCTKIPLCNKEGQAIGIAGALSDYNIAGSILKPYSEIAKVIKYMNDNFHKEITIQSLAKLAIMSESQLQRKFKKLLHTTPMKYITKLRLNSACHALSQSNDSITQIAQCTGFYDHSYFTKVFTKQIGVTPKEYRRQYYKKDE